jgi:hypothetical protein
MDESLQLRPGLRISTLDGTISKTPINWIKVANRGLSYVDDVATLDFTKFGNYATWNDPAWANLGANPQLAGGADSNDANPLNSNEPSLVFQTVRQGGQVGHAVFAYSYLFHKKAGPGDAYVVGYILRYDPDMTGFANGEYNQTCGIRHVVLAHTNKPAGCNVYGYNVDRVERAPTVTNARALAHQSEPVTWDNADLTAETQNSTIAYNAGGGGAAFHSLAFQIEAGMNGRTSFALGFKPKVNSVRLQVLDMLRGTYRAVGSVKVTNANNEIVPNVANVSAATNASPIVITTTAAHGFEDGEQVTVAGVTGNTAANGTRYVKATGHTATTFALYLDVALSLPVAGNGAYAGAGTVTSVTFFSLEFNKGDFITVDGVNWYNVNVTPVTDVSMQITPVFNEATAVGKHIIKTVPPLRLLVQSHITATSDATDDFGIIGATADKKVWADKDGKTILAGTAKTQITTAAGLLRNQALDVPHFVQVKNSANIVLTSGNFDTILYDTEVFDVDGMHSTAANTGRLNALIDGIYRITLNVSFEANANGLRVAYIQHSVDGIIAITSVNAVGGGVTTDMCVSTEKRMTAGQYVFSIANQNTGGNLNLLASGSRSAIFTMTRIGS